MAKVLLWSSSVNRRLYALPLLILGLASPVSGQVAWFHSPEGPVTHTFRDGRTVGTEQGIRIRVDGSTIRVLTRVHRHRAWDCDWEALREGGPFEVETNRWNVTRSLVMIGSDGEQTVIAPSSMGESMTEIDDRIRVVASVGPYILVRRDFYYLPLCPPHFFGGTSWRWFDLRNGAEVELEAPDALRPQIDDAEKQMRETLHTLLVSNQNPPPMRPEYDDFRVVSVAPRLVQGRWRTSVIVVLDGPYVWGGPAYERSETIHTLEELPAPLAQYGRVPRAVRTFLRSHRRWKLGGVSR